MPLAPIEALLDDLRAGKMVILVDDEDRENEGDLVCPASAITPEAVTFMLSVARGYLCLAMTEADCDRLNLHPQAHSNTTARGTAFTVSVDLHPKHGGTTGVSAKERARCIQMMIDPRYGPADFARPGHINPLRSRDGGVLVRTGQTEGSVDLCRLAGLYPAAAIIEIMRDDGEMARRPDLEALAAKHNLKIGSVAQLIQHRLARETFVSRLEPARGRPVRTPWGEFRAILFRSAVDPLPHLVLAMGDVGVAHRIDDPVLVRVHRRHLLGDAFLDLDSSPEGPTGDVLHASMRAIADEGRGALVYLRTTLVDDDADALDHELEGSLQSMRTGPAPGADDPTRPARAPGVATLGASPIQREVGVGSQILRQLGITRLRLLTRSGRAWPDIESFGLEIVERVAPPIDPR